MAIAGAGALNGLAREFPRAAADGNQHEMQELVRSACWINSLGTILFAGLPAEVRAQSDPRIQQFLNAEFNQQYERTIV